jgi:arylformamidase
MFVSLSYVLSEDTPVLLTNPTVKFEPLMRMAKGDITNVTMLHLFSHHGTHMDAPWHWNPAGKTIDQLGFEHLIFDRPKLVDARKRPNYPVDRTDIEPSFSKNDDTDLLMVLSGISLVRESNPEEYTQRFPSFTIDAARFIVDETRVRAVAMDFGAVDSAESLCAGKAPVHDILLGTNDASSRTLVLVEEANLMPLLGKKVKRVYAIPLMLKGLDASPVNMFAEVE